MLHVHAENQIPPSQGQGLPPPSDPAFRFRPTTRLGVVLALLVSAATGCRGRHVPMRLASRPNPPRRRARYCLASRSADSDARRAAQRRAGHMLRLLVSAAAPPASITSYKATIPAPQVAPHYGLDHRRARSCWGALSRRPVKTGLRETDKLSRATRGGLASHSSRGTRSPLADVRGTRSR